MEKLIKIIQSPFDSNLATVEDIVLTIFVPYSETDVTIKINPTIEDYKEKIEDSNVNINQLMVTTNNEQTQQLTFDFKENKIHKVKVNEHEYEIQLMKIGKENIENQDFPYFEFLIKC